MKTIIDPNTFFKGIHKASKSLLDNYQNDCHDKYIKTKKFKKYKEFKDLLVKGLYTSKPHKNTCYASQGCTEIDDITLITSYDTCFDHKHRIRPSRHDSNNSILDIIDKNGRVKTLYFDNTSHVGGIAYSPKHKRIYVSRANANSKTPYARVNTYSIETVAELKNNDTILDYTEIALKNNKKVSYLTIDDNDLLVGEFEEKQESKLVRYLLNSYGTEVKLKEEYIVPYFKVQGVTTFIKDNKKYYAFSCSYGRRKNSTLIIAKLKDKTLETIKEIKLPCMSEQVSTDTNGNLMILFESDSIKYGQGLLPSKTSISNVCHLDINKILK